MRTLLWIACFAGAVLAGSREPRWLPVETLDAIGALPAHIAGQFNDISACDQSREGEYFVFDRRSHAVFAIAPPYDTARTLVQIGVEPGRLLHPTAFDLAPDGRFVVADAPNRKGRIQMFLTSGARVGGF